MSEVFDPVGAAGRQRGNVPLNRRVTLPVRTLQPVKPAARHVKESLVIGLQRAEVKLELPVSAPEEGKPH